MNKILITGIGGDIAQSIAKIIRNSGLSVNLIGTDVNAAIPWKSFVDSFHQVPSANNSEFLSILESIITNGSIDLLIPVPEKELEAISQARTNQNWQPAKIVMVSNYIISLFLDKLKTIEFLAAHSISVPWTMELEEEPKSYPCILKHRFGVGSRGFTLIKNARDLEYFRQKRSGWVLQELLLPRNEEYTCGVYAEKDQEAIVVVMKRILESGHTKFAQVIYDQEIIALCMKIAGLVNLHGSINIQLRKTSRGPIIFEINPRFSGTSIFRDHFGFRDVVWSIMDTLTIPHQARFNYTKALGKKFFRVYSEIFEEDDQRR